MWRKSFVTGNIARYRDTGNVAWRPISGRKTTVTTLEGKARFDRNSCRGGRKIARELNITRERMQHILKNDLGLKLLKFWKCKNLLRDKKKNRLERTKQLLRLHESSQLPKMVFSDEKPLQTEQFLNKQNVGFTCQRSQLKIYVCNWTPELKHRRW